MKKILLEPEDYYTQRNNSFKPFEACMPTSWTMWCIAIGRKRDLRAFCAKNNIDINKIDDWAMQELNTPRAIAFALEKYPTLSAYSPNQIHGMYHSYLEPLIFGRAISDFFPSKSTFDEILKLAFDGFATWTSGAFAGIHGPIDGHAFAIVGADDVKRELLLADPYGNFASNYAETKGYLIDMDEPQAVLHIKPLQEKKKNIHIERGFYK